jgi:two-component system invasion response regulator UvrY
VKSILIVDDHQIIRAGVKELLFEHKGFSVAGEANSGAEALEMVRESNWDLILLDISMAGMNGIDTLKQIKLIKPDLPVLILSMHPEDHYGIHMIRAGASGYLHKQCTSQELVNAIAAIASGRLYVSHALAKQIANSNAGNEVALPHNRLSQREFQVLCKLAVGRAVCEIAKDLSLDKRTVTTYRTRCLEKMGLKTNVHLTHYAIKHDLID